MSKLNEIQTSQLNPNEIEELKQLCHQHGIIFEQFGIDTISFDLYNYYPKLAKDCLGVEIDTGQIVRDQDFVEDYDKSAIATPLDTQFYFREEELKQVLSHLENNNLVVISGKAGVGKTRLVLESCRQFIAQYSDYEFYCIRWRGLDIYDDLKGYFSKSGYYLIFIDDVNRVSNFDYFLYLLKDQREDQSMKVIVTVRDYALEKIQEKLKKYQFWTSLEIHPFKDEEIKQLVKNEYQINHTLYLDRIVDIAQGNPRLAMMAAKVAIQENNIMSINDVSQLYDQYFDSICQELKELKNQTVLKTAAIIAFFRIVDQSNQEMMTLIEQVFNLSSLEFWESACQLHQWELVDMYEKEVVKVSDQVLANYLFYLACFQEEVISFANILNHLFPAYQYRLIDILNPIISLFDFKKVKEMMSPEIDKVWDQYVQSEDQKITLEFIKIFWFLKQTETLIYASEMIEEMEQEKVDLSSLEIKPSYPMSVSPVLEILSLFKSADPNNLSMALDLILAYFEKRPSQLSVIVKLLTEDYGFKPDSYHYNYDIQNFVIDKLTEKVENSIFAKLFMEVSQKYLHTKFENHISKENTISITTFWLPNIPKTIDLRRKIWQQLFDLYRHADFQEDILKLFLQYIGSWHQSESNEVLRQDSLEILPFLDNNLNPESYYHCYVVQKYLLFLKRHHISFDHNLKDKFTNPTFNLSKILLSNRVDTDLDFSEDENYRQQQINSYFKDYSLQDYQTFFQQAVIIQNETLRENINISYQIELILKLLANKDSDLFIQVLAAYLQFNRNNQNNNKNDFQDRKDQLLEELIKEKGQDIRFISFLFTVICKFTPERRKKLIATFIEINSNFEDFKQIPLKLYFGISSGSLMLDYQGKRDYLTSLLPLFNGIKYLKHKLYLEQQIKWLESAIKEEEKKNFMSDY